MCVEVTVLTSDLVSGGGDHSLVELHEFSDDSDAAFSGRDVCTRHPVLY